MIIQEYYRNYEDHNQILSNYINDKTPKNILILLKISLTLLFFSDKPVFAIVNDAVKEGKILSKEKYKELGANAFEFSKGFSWEKIIKNYISLI